MVTVPRDGEDIPSDNRYIQDLALYQRSGRNPVGRPVVNILVCSIVAAALVAAMPLMAPEATAGEKFRSGLSVGSKL